jgi:hypothetical protein
MNKSYIAVLGMINEATTEKIVLKEIAVIAKDQYEAHKLALFKCNLSNNEIVFIIREAATKLVKFDHVSGFSV